MQREVHDATSQIPTFSITFDPPLQSARARACVCVCWGGGVNMLCYGQTGGWTDIPSDVSSGRSHLAQMCSRRDGKNEIARTLE